MLYFALGIIKMKNLALNRMGYQPINRYTYNLTTVGLTCQPVRGIEAVSLPLENLRKKTGFLPSGSIDGLE